MTLKGLSDFIVAKSLVVDVAVEIEKIGGDRLQTIAKRTLAPSLELVLLSSYDVTKTRDSISNAIRKVIVSSRARS
jgi:hypothetical protein